MELDAGAEVNPRVITFALVDATSQTATTGLAPEMSQTWTRGMALPRLWVTVRVVDPPIAPEL